MTGEGCEAVDGCRLPGGTLNRGSTGTDITHPLQGDMGVDTVGGREGGEEDHWCRGV